MVENLLLGARIWKADITKLDCLNLTAGNRWFWLCCFRQCIFDLEDTLCRTVSFQQTCHHEGQVKGGRKRCCCRKGKCNRSNWIVDATRSEHACAHQNQNSCQIDKEIWKWCDRLAMECQPKWCMIDLIICPLDLLCLSLSCSKNLNIADAVNTLKNLWFKYSKAFSIAHSDSASSLKRRKRKHHADHKIDWN